MKGAFDWIGRTAVLALSVMATLAMMSSLASISGSTIGGLLPRAGELALGTSTGDQPPPLLNEIASDDGTDTTLTNTASDTVRVPAPPPPRDQEMIRWLKALTYAVQALAIVAAVGVIVLLRLTAILSRIANR